METKDSLSLENSLVLVHYKEPLKKIPASQGFGYYGAIMMSLDGEKMQCHVCGKLFQEVGTHSRQGHGIPVDEYREKFQLASSTSLISEKIRIDRKERTLAWLASISDEQRVKIQSMYKKNGERLKQWVKDHGAHGKKIKLETKNKRGTCPDQLIAKILEVSKKLGVTPNKDEFIAECGTQRYVHLIYKTFGSWSEALKKAGLQERKGGGVVGTKPVKKSDEELLDALSLFYTENGEIPTETDSRRGYIPSTDIYRRRFGSIQKARELAGIYEVPVKKEYSKFVGVTAHKN